MESFKNYFIGVLKNFKDFDSRARRKEYWMFVLFNMIVSTVVNIIARNLGVYALSNLYSLLILVPAIAVGVRRMHDVGKSGWFLLIPFYNLYLLVIDGEIGDNQYGADPKAGER